MSSFAVVLFLIIGAAALYGAYKLKKLLKVGDGSFFMKKESERIVFKNAEVDSDYTSTGRVYTRGLSLIKNKQTGKYNLIAQAKVCDIGLY